MHRRAAAMMAACLALVARTTASKVETAHSRKVDAPLKHDPCSWQNWTWTRPACQILHRAYGLGLLRDSLYIDVGAHGGGELRLATSLGHPYIGFECNYAEYRTLRDSYHRVMNVTLINACVSDASGLVKLYNALDSSSLDPAQISRDPMALDKVNRDITARTGSSRGFDKAKTRASELPFQRVVAVTLDQVLMGSQRASAVLPRIGFLKIDVQGHEAAVLRGSAELLRKHAPFVYYEDYMLPLAERNGTILRSLVPGYECDCCLVLDKVGKNKNKCSGQDCFCVPPMLNQYLNV